MYRRQKAAYLNLLPSASALLSPARSASQAEADCTDATDAAFKPFYYKSDELEKILAFYAKN